MLAAIQADFAQLSPQLRKIALFIEKSRELLALVGVQEIARQCGVQPSAIVRFSKRFGFSGFSELQALFTAGAHQQLGPGSDYQGRIRSLIDIRKEPLSSARLAREVIAASMDSLEALERNLSEPAFNAAVDLLIDAPTIWLAGARRSFSVAAYLAYALQQTGKPVQWLHGLGLMQQTQLNSLTGKDVLIAISFEHYAQETLAVIEAAARPIAAPSANRSGRISPSASAKGAPASNR